MQNTNKKTAPATGLQEIRTLVQNDIPPLPEISPNSDLGELSCIQNWVARSQHKPTPEIRHPRIACFVTEEDREKLSLDTLSTLATEANADLKVYELGAETNGTTITEEEAAHALTYGMMAIQPGIDLISISAGSAVHKDLQRALANTADPLSLLGTHGTLPLAATVGCIIAARLARVPVIVDGAEALLAVDILKSAHAQATDHCQIAENILTKQTHLTTGVAGALLVPFIKSLVRI